MAAKLTRRQFVGYGGTAALGVFLASRTSFLNTDPAMAIQSPQIPLPGSAIPQFIDPVPNLLDDAHRIVAGTGQIVLEMKQHVANILPATLPLPMVPGGLYKGTYVWGYLQPEQTERNSYIGPVVIATRGTPTEMKFVNLLGTAANTNVLAYKYSTDQTLHWADPLNNEANMWNHMAMPPAPGSDGAKNYSGSIPACVHLHGGEVPPEIDGGPDAWFTSDGNHKGHGFYSRDGAAATNYSTYRYPNSGEGALVWFHDHTLGATRLNVYAGLAGGYLIVDPSDPLQLAPIPGQPLKPGKLPELFPLVIQDRMFDQEGQLYFPADSSGGILWAPNPEHPYWVPEFVGDTIVVNGKSWPYMNVQPRRYTLIMINGSNARTYEMALTDPVSKNPGPPLWVVGTDGGYLDKPVKIDPVAAANNKLVMMSGERYWVIVDFKGYEAGKVGPNGAVYSGKWDLKNTAKTPYPAGATPSGPMGKIMRFVVAGGPVTDTSFNPAALGATLRGGAGQVPAIVRLSSAPVQKKRQLTLNEVMGMPQTATNPVTGLPAAYPGGPLEILVNNTKWSGERINGVTIDSMSGMKMYTMETRSDFTLDSQNTNWLSEVPKEGETEQWEIINLTADAHPIHLHLVQFQLVNRQAFDTAKYSAAYAAAFTGGGYDPMTQLPYPAGVYIPGFGPPLPYETGLVVGGIPVVGGNPDINEVNLKTKKPLYLQGPVKPALPQENGWKDTVVMFPGQVTRILVRWAPTSLAANTPPAQANFPFNPRPGGSGEQGYVWHCHIVDHEDNEMMRPDEVVPNPGATRTYIKGTDY